MAEPPRLLRAELLYRAVFPDAPGLFRAQVVEATRHAMLLLPQAVLRPRACLFLFQRVKARYLLDLLSYLVQHGRVCLADRVALAAGLRRQPGSHHQPARRCPLIVQPHAWAEEYSSGSRF